MLFVSDLYCLTVSRSYSAEGLRNGGKIIVASLYCWKDSRFCQTLLTRVEMTSCPSNLLIVYLFRDYLSCSLSPFIGTILTPFIPNTLFTGIEFFIIAEEGRARFPNSFRSLFGIALSSLLPIFFLFNYYCCCCYYEGTFPSFLLGILFLVSCYY